MAWTIELVQGSTSLDLNDETNYKCQVDDINIGQPPARQLWHVPDYGERQLVRVEDDDRTASLGIWVKGSAADDPENNILTLRRWCKEAIRYELTKDNDPVYLKIQRDGSTNATLNQIKYAEVDDSSSHYSQDKIARTDAPNTRLLLILTPAGEAESAITLRNDLASSPHFVEGSGLADGWTAYEAATVESLDTISYLIGGKSQKIDGSYADQTEGIYSDNIPCSQFQNVVAYAWIAFGSQCDDITVIISDNTGSIASKKIATGDSGGVSDKSHVDKSGRTWYRVSLSGTTAATATTVFLAIYRAAADGTQTSTFYVDGCYVQLENNPVLNGGFETAAGGSYPTFEYWNEIDDLLGFVTDETTLVHTGSHALKISENTSGPGGYTVYQDISVIPGVTYDISFYTRGDGTGEGAYSVYDLINDVDIIELTQTGITGTAYTKVTDSFTPAFNCTKVRFSLYNPWVGSLASCYYDSITVSPGTSAIPDAWMSSSTVYNRGDVSEGYHNYWDVWGVPGDAPGLVSTVIEMTSISGSADSVYIGKGTDGIIPVGLQVHWVDSDAFDTDADPGEITWSSQTGSNTNDQWYRGTYNSGPAGTRRVTYSGQDAVNLISGPKRVVGRIRTSDSANVTVSLQVKLGIYTILQSETLSLNGDDAWEMVDFGSMNAEGIGVRINESNTLKNNELFAELWEFVDKPDVQVNFTIGGLGSGDTCDFDYFVFFPTVEFFIAKAGSAFATAQKWAIRAIYEDFVGFHLGYAEAARGGELWKVIPGTTTSRYIWQSYDDSNRNLGIGDTYIISLNVIPRTRHLLGTI